MTVKKKTIQNKNNLEKRDNKYIKNYDIRKFI